MSNNNALIRPVIALALSVPLLLGGQYAGEVAQSITGPLAIAVGDQQVAIAAPGLLYRLDFDGSLLTTDEDVIAPGIRDAGLLWLQDTLLASPGANDGEFLRCTTDGCAPFSADPYAPTGAVQVYVDGRILWLAETEADRLHRFRADGTRIDMPLSDLARPGSVLREGNSVLICNTGSASIDGHRIHKTGMDNGKQWVTLPSGDAEDPVNRPLRLLADNRGGYRLLLTNEARSHGMLMRVSANHQLEPVALPLLSNPVSMAWLGDDLLVVDEDLMQVVRIGADGETSLFGDEDFRNRLAADRNMREILRVLLPALVLLSALAAAIGGSWLLREIFRRQSDPARNTTPVSNGIVWMLPEQELLGERTQRNLVIAAPAALFPALAAGWLGSAAAGIGWVLLVALAAAVPAYLAARRARLPLDTRIGIRNRRLVITDAEHGLREFPLGQVQWSESHLQPTGSERIELVRNGIPLYHRPTLVAALFPQLDPAREIASP